MIQGIFLVGGEYSVHMSIKKQRKKFPFSLQQSVVKFAIMCCTIGIGLWCGWHDSYGAFYIAVLVQAINNMYDSFGLLKGYNKFITYFQFASFLGALIAAILAIIHFAPGGSCVDTGKCLLLVSICLSIPLIHLGIEAYLMIRNDLY